VIGQSEQGRDRAEGQSGAHHQRRIHPLAAAKIEYPRERQDAHELRRHLHGAVYRGIDLDSISHVELQNERAISVTGSDVFDLGGISSGHDSPVAAIENHFSQLAAKAGRAAGDEPHFLVSHVEISEQILVHNDPLFNS